MRTGLTRLLCTLDDDRYQALNAERRLLLTPHRACSVDNRPRDSTACGGHMATVLAIEVWHMLSKEIFDCRLFRDEVEAQSTREKLPPDEA